MSSSSLKYFASTDSYTPWSSNQLTRKYQRFLGPSVATLYSVWLKQQTSCHSLQMTRSWNGMILKAKEKGRNTVLLSGEKMNRSNLWCRAVNNINSYNNAVTHCQGIKLHSPAWQAELLITILTRSCHRKLIIYATPTASVLMQCPTHRCKQVYKIINPY